MLDYIEDKKTEIRRKDAERKWAKKASGLPIGVYLRKDGAYTVRVSCNGRPIEESVHRKLPDALEALREARIDVHNRQMIAIDKALEKFGAVL